MAKVDNLCSTVRPNGIICVVQCGTRGQFLYYSVAQRYSLVSTVWQKEIICVVQFAKRDNLCSRVWHKGITLEYSVAQMG